MKDNEFLAINDNGEQVKCEIIHIFEFNNNSYIIYTDNKLDEDNDLNILVSRYEIINNELILYDVETDGEWDYIDKEWSKYNAF